MSSLISQIVSYGEVEISHRCSIIKALLEFCNIHKKIPVLESLVNEEL